MSELYRSDRHFKVWQYTVSHRRLLLRSTRDKPPETRIDVHFGAVSFMLLCPYYDGLIIREGSDKECQWIINEYGAEVKSGYLFVLGRGFSSFVVSGKPQWHEDDGGSKDPSWFGHMIGTP